QKAAEEAFAGRRGAAIALDPNNGDVLALVSLPGFDPSLFGRGITTREYRALADDIDRPLVNRAIMGTYPAGSTVKPVLGMAGLAYGKVTPDQRKYCPGEFRVPGSSRRAREGRGGVHGSVDLRTALRSEERRVGKESRPRYSAERVSAMGQTRTRVIRPHS